MKAVWVPEWNEVFNDENDSPTPAAGVGTPPCPAGAAVVVTCTSHT